MQTTHTHTRARARALAQSVRQTEYIRFDRPLTDNVYSRHL